MYENSPSQHLPMVRTMPHSPEAEMAVLGSILLDDKVLDVVLDRIKQDEDFFSEANRHIFAAMKALWADNTPVEPTTLLARLKGNVAVEAAGGTHYVLSLPNRVPSAVNAEHYARIVQEKSVLRRLIELTGTVNQQAFQQVDNVEVFLDDVERQVFALASQETKQDFAPVKEVMRSLFIKLEERMLNKESVTGVSTGFRDLDAMLAGFQPSDLIILAARPSMGKTALGMNFAATAAIHHGVPTAIFSLEMSAEQLVQRMLCSEARVDAGRLRTGIVNDGEWARLIEGAGSFSHAPIFIDETPALPIMRLQGKVRRLKAEHGLGLIVVDYLQLMKGDSRLNSREQEISDISRNLKAIAKELNIPVVALSQLNRGVDGRADKRPMLSDLRESGAIEQDADVIMFIYRDEVYNKDSTEKGVAEVLVSKQRNGSIGTVKLKWFGMYTRFENLEQNVHGHPF